MYTKIAVAIVLFAAGNLQTMANEFVMSASCRITAANQNSRSFGSGVVIKETQASYYIATCGHVVDNGIEFYIEFFKGGNVSPPIPAAIVASKYVENTTIDAAILMVSKDRLMGYKPGVISLAPSHYQPRQNQIIYGAGCPSGKWLQYWQSRINKNYGNAIGLNMSPISGQSGSGIITDINGRPYVIGVVTWSTSDGPNGGGGVSVSRMYESIYGNPVRDVIPINYKTVAEKSLETLFPDEDCNFCKLPRSQHRKDVGAGGKILLFCPKCEEHGLYYHEHLKNGMKPEQFCGPGGCYPYRPRGPEAPQIPPQQPQGPSPQAPLPGDLFPQDVPPTDPTIIIDAPEEHPLGENGPVIEKTSLTLLGAGIGAFLWNMFGVPFLVKRAGKLPARILLALGQGVLAKKAGDVVNPAPAPVSPTAPVEPPKVEVTLNSNDAFKKTSGEIATIVAEQIGKMIHEGVVRHYHTGTVDMVPPTLGQSATATEIVAEKNPLPPQIPEGLSRDRQYFNVPFQKKTPSAEQVMGILGEIENEYANDKTMTPAHTLTLLRQRLKMRYGVE